MTCQKCGYVYLLDSLNILTDTQREQYKRAVGLAEKLGVDLPSAYSVLLGILSPDQAKTLRAAAPEKRAETKETVEPPPVVPVPVPNASPSPPVKPKPVLVEEYAYDPGFRAAVRDGTLTERQAVERGNRKAWAIRLAETQNLPLNLAYRVADGRMTVREARAEHQAQKDASRPAPPPVPITPRQQTAVAMGAAVVFLALLVVGVSAWHGYNEEVRVKEEMAQSAADRAAAQEEVEPQEIEEPAWQTEPMATEVDSEGRILAVSGPSPRLVLIEYCTAASESRRCEPVELAPTVPPYPGARLGIYRDPAQLDKLFAIKIRKDPRSRRWSVGDGVRPISAIVAPQQPPDAKRVPIVM